MAAMKLRTSDAFVAVVAALPAAACASRTEPAPRRPVDPYAFDGEPSRDAAARAKEHEEACGPVVDVPAGPALVAEWLYDPATRRFSPRSDCSPPVYRGSRLLHVPAHRMMKVPVTKACYAACVRDGACSAPPADARDPDARSWDDAARAREPIGASATRARTFCHWFGGRLPSLAERLRIMAGSSTEFGVPAMVQTLIDCTLRARTDATCTALEQMDWSPLHFAGTLPPPAGPGPALQHVGSLAEDTGPFGHQDVFGGVYEWTQSNVTPRGEWLCELGDGAVDPIRSSKGSDRLAAFQHLTPARHAIQGRATGVDIGIADPETQEYWIGFRCAF
jgi:formylglycine-generating enzyme required for sulfatase activity